MAKKYVEMTGTANLSPQITVGQLLQYMRTKAGEEKIKKEIEKQDKKESK